MKPLIYLAGPITGCDHSEATDWREKISNELTPHGIQTLSPMRGKPVLPKGEVYDAATNKYPDPLRSEKGINTRDFNDVKRADLVLVNFLGAKKVSIGTVMEIAWARVFGKPVILMMEEKGNVHDHTMLKYACGFIVQSIEEAIRIAKFVLLTDQDLAYVD